MKRFTTNQLIPKLAIGIAGLLLLASCGGGSDSDSDGYSPISNSTCTVTLERYSQVTGGMSATQVNAIYGCVGEDLTGVNNGVFGLTWTDAYTGDTAGAAFSSIYPVNGYTGLYYKSVAFGDVLYETSY